MIENLTARLRSCATLPTVPGIALRIVDLASQPDADIAQIGDCISMDPALSAKFLRVARSPLFQGPRNAANVRQAVSLMGTHAAIMIALSFSLDATHEGTIPRRPVRQTFWRRALLTALSAHALGEKLGLKKLDDVFLAGLLQDIGILALDAMLADPYEKIPHDRLSHDALLEAERKAFGTGHDEIGYWLLMQWGFPDYLALSCLANQHLAHEQAPLSKMTACVTVAGLMADCLLSPDDPHLKPLARQAAQTHLPLGDEAFSDVLGAVSARLPEVETLIAPRPINSAEVQSILNEARDLQILRQLNRDMTLERESRRDAMTRAHSRDYLDSLLPQEFDLATRNDWPLSVAMIDIDHLRRINAEYGRHIGDAVLISFARAVQAQIRASDLFARHDSARFALVMPGTAQDPAKELMENLRASLNNIEHVRQHRRAPLGITVSIGLASHAGDTPRFECPADLLQAASAALAQAKAAGRNRLGIWA